MATLVFKSTNALDADVESLDLAQYRQRVIEDGGFIADEAALEAAFQFCVNNSINSGDVFSATSPRWGVKLAGGKPAKLYSLFNEAGDILVAVGSPSALFYDTTTFTVPVLDLRAASGNALMTVGTANDVRTSGICVIGKVPVLAAGGNYGSSNSFAMGELHDITPSASAAESLDKRMNTAFYVRSNTTELANVWRYSANGYGTQGTITTTAAELSDATGWNKTATYLQAGLMQMFKDGAVLKQDTTVLSSSWLNNLYFNIGRSRSAASAELVYTSAYYGYIVEAWCLTNTVAAKMQALSLRASQVYAGI